MADDKSLQESFLLGISVAKYVHDSAPQSEQSKGAIFRTLKEVADGSLTLFDSWAEFSGALPPIPADEAEGIEMHYEQARANERAIAGRVAAGMPEELFGGL